MPLKYISDPVEGMPGLRPFKGTAVKIVVHTTETAVKPNWQEKRKGLPHYTLDGNTAYSHLPLDISAYTLAGADFSPNSDAGVNIQIEWVGYAKDTPTRSDADYAALAELLVDISQKINCPWEFPFPFAGDDGYGPSGVVRQSWSKFEASSGIMGHSHAPYNNHWDPGVLNIARLTKLKPAVIVDYKRIEEIGTRLAQTSTAETVAEIKMLTDRLTILQNTVDDLKNMLLSLRFVVDK